MCQLSGCLQEHAELGISESITDRVIPFGSCLVCGEKLHVIDDLIWLGRNVKHAVTLEAVPGVLRFRIRKILLVGACMETSPTESSP